MFLMVSRKDTLLGQTHIQDVSNGGAFGTPSRPSCRRKYLLHASCNQDSDLMARSGGKPPVSKGNICT